MTDDPKTLCSLNQWKRWLDQRPCPCRICTAARNYVNRPEAERWRPR